MNPTRREFFSRIGRTGAVAPFVPVLAGVPGEANDSTSSLNGAWLFRLDPSNHGEAQGWHLASAGASGWSQILVPHTWQTEQENAGYHGAAWYRKEFRAPAEWANRWVRLEFEAAYHSAAVWVNGMPAGRHTGKGYTAFTVDISPMLKAGRSNLVAVRVENSFDPNMLPRAKSFDWTEDGGIIRPVNVLATPRAFIERVDVDAVPDLAADRATLGITAAVRNAGKQAVSLPLEFEVAEEDTGHIVATGSRSGGVELSPGAIREIAFAPAVIGEPRLWHFDHPNLYRLTATLGEHSYTTTFGVRSFEARGGGFYLNGERMRLMGVERMAGSNPEYGMAEPESWIAHDHRDMKELNAVFTRVHWQQDRRLLDWCDRNGLMVQPEVPAWGPETFRGMGEMPDQAMVENGLEQLREMIRRDRNHPCVFAWGLCNEVNGQNAPAREFIRRLRDEARRLDPRRLLTYASNSLQKSPGSDAAELLDFISWNEYYESWMAGSIGDMRRNLEEIHAAFPDKPVVVSEYGFCECNPRHAGGDPRRIQILRQHDEIFRACAYVGGAIFFCYNDYRTHIGDRGLGPLKQRVHGVVDLYGARKPSFDTLRRESSPVEELILERGGNGWLARLRTRSTLPAYRLEGYRLRWTIYGNGGLPMEVREVGLAAMAPGAQLAFPIAFEFQNPERIRLDVMRPTGFSAAAAEWRP